MLDAMQKTTEDAEKEPQEQLESLEDCAKKTVLAAKLCRAPDLLVRPSGGSFSGYLQLKTLRNTYLLGFAREPNTP